MISCEDCGSEGCKPGDWVAMRKIGDKVLLIPYFDDMDMENGDKEYYPPKYIVDHGIIELAPSDFFF